MTRTLPPPRTQWTRAARPWFPRGARSLFRCGTGQTARCQRGRNRPRLVKSGQTQARCTAAQEGKDPTKVKKDSKAKVGEKRGTGGDEVGRPPLVHCPRASFIPLSEFDEAQSGAVGPRGWSKLVKLTRAAPAGRTTTRTPTRAPLSSCGARRPRPPPGPGPPASLVARRPSLPPRAGSRCPRPAAPRDWSKPVKLMLAGGAAGRFDEEDTQESPIGEWIREARPRPPPPPLHPV